MEIIGFLSAIVIGVTLGLIGGGGSILTIPVLVYFFHIDPVLATTYSLFVVGFTSLIGSFSYFKSKLVDLRTAFLFGIPSIIAVVLTRMYVLPAIPNELFRTESFTLTKDILLMLLFAVLMLFASFSMIKKQATKGAGDNHTRSYYTLFLQGSAVGFVTGLVGAGGGFLIIPVLVNGLEMSIKRAIGTSLIIIAINSLFGFTTSIYSIDVDWRFLGAIVVLATIGVYIGSYLSKMIDGKKLKPAFGWFVLAMGVYILSKELLF